MYLAVGRAVCYSVQFMAFLAHEQSGLYKSLVQVKGSKNNMSAFSYLGSTQSFLSLLNIDDDK